MTASVLGLQPRWNRQTAGSDHGPSNCRRDSGDRQSNRRDNGLSNSDSDLYHYPPDRCPNDKANSVDDIVAGYSDHLR